MLEHTTVLFVDDEPEIRNSLKRLTRRLPGEFLFAGSAAEALQLLASKPIDVIVSDVNMPGMSGLELLAEAAVSHPETVRIVLTAHSDRETVMVAINEGRIWGYIVKPWDNSQLKITLEQAAYTKRLLRERALLAHTVQEYERFSRDRFGDFIGDSPSMQGIYQLIETAAPSSASVFITGSSGTGKELAARAVHDHSGRRTKPFVALNCAAIPRDLLESEMFGHVRGAFSGATSNRDGAAMLADGGTLFFDELTEMDVSLQAKLLRFIQTGTFQRVGSSKQETVNVRFVCATNRDPLQAIADGRLREDLYYRLNVIMLPLPDLAERGWDVVSLAGHFLQEFCSEEEKMFVGFAEDAERLLLAHPWPGNVRQLRHAVQNAVIVNAGPLVTAAMLGTALGLGADALAEYLRAGGSERQPLLEGTTQAMKGGTGDASIRPLAAIEREAIEDAIRRSGDNVTRAAEALGVSPSTLYRKMRHWGGESDAA